MTNEETGTSVRWYVHAMTQEEANVWRAFDELRHIA